jgi:hypothetical protein
VAKVTTGVLLAYRAWQILSGTVGCESRYSQEVDVLITFPIAFCRVFSPEAQDTCRIFEKLMEMMIELFVRMIIEAEVKAIVYTVVCSKRVLNDRLGYIEQKPRVDLDLSTLGTILGASLVLLPLLSPSPSL